MKIKIILILLIFFFPNIIYGNKWYVSISSSGNGNGSSWANKRILSNFNWTQVQPGDTVFVDGGTDSLIYNYALSPSRSGTSGNRIIITRGLDEGHNGKPVFRVNANFVAEITHDYLTISHISFMGDIQSRTDLQVVYIYNCTNVTLDYIEIYNPKNCAIRISGGDNVKVLHSKTDTGTSNPADANTDCFRIDASAGEIGNSLEIAYCELYMRNTDASNTEHKDVIQTYQWQMDDTGVTKIHHNFLVSYGGPNTTSNSLIEGGAIGGEVQVYNNVMVHGGTFSSSRAIYFGNCGEDDIEERMVTKFYNNTIYLTNTEDGGCRFNSQDSLFFKNNIIYYPNGTYLTMMADLSSITYKDIDYNQYVGYHGGDATIFGSIDCSDVQTSRTFAQWKTYLGSPNETHSEASTSTSFFDWHGSSFPSFIPFDYSLDIGSPGINEGTTISLFTDDYNGNARTSAWDVGAFEFVESTSSNFQIEVEIYDGWNLVSIPGLHPINQNISTWWSGIDPTAGVFRFSSGNYFPITTTTPNQSYWMKHIGSNIYNTGDEWPAGGINLVPHNPIIAMTGWNFIGGYELNVSTSGITTTPAGLQIGPVFQYSSGYTPSTNIKPGYGYLIKLSGDGSINIPNTLAKGLANTIEVNTSDWGKIIITDKSGKSYTLYTVKGEVNLNDYELPPAPPEGMFDVRFGSGRYAEELSAENQTIELNSLEYPVRVRVENADIRLQDGTGNGLNERLKSGEEVVISNSSVNKLMVSGNIIPATYSLDQNYPNPFNSSSIIKYSIPKSSLVTLKIFNTLGEEIATLVNEEKLAGTYELNWNASNLPSGVYFYVLHSANFIQTRKMILLK